jgi:hypothetical protein
MVLITLYVIACWTWSAQGMHSQGSDCSMGNFDEYYIQFHSHHDGFIGDLHISAKYHARLEAHPPTVVQRAIASELTVLTGTHRCRQETHRAQPQQHRMQPSNELLWKQAAAFGPQGRASHTFEAFTTALAPLQATLSTCSDDVPCKKTLS